ncbi:hypothetical protein HMPREF2139_00225 [Prevotella denticola DNF00960]|nr:hypothetical protein HMPREF2139_00225 [Prevotella denticola DNF00960]
MSGTIVNICSTSKRLTTIFGAWCHATEYAHLPSHALVRLDHDARQLNRNADRPAETDEADRQDSPDSHTPEVWQSYPKGPTAGLFFLSSARHSSPLERLGEGEQDGSKIVS